MSFFIQRSIYTTCVNGVRDQIINVNCFVDALVVYEPNAARALWSGSVGAAGERWQPAPAAGFMNNNPLARRPFGHRKKRVH